MKSEPILHAEQDPEMARYLDRSYWDQKNREETSKVPSAPSHVNHSPSPQPASSAPVSSLFISRLILYCFVLVGHILLKALLSLFSFGFQSTHQVSSSAAILTTTSAAINNIVALDTSPKLQQNGVPEDNEIDEFVNTLRSQVEIFVNRMKSNSSRGRSIANDSSVQTLFMNITAMHSRLLRFIQQQDDSRGLYDNN